MLDGATRAAAVMLLAEEVATRASEALRDAAIEHLVVKGIATAHALYDDPLSRPFTDVDVLVRWRDQRRASSAMRRAGFRQGPIATTHSSVWAAPLRDAPDADVQAWVGWPFVPVGGFDALFANRAELPTRRGAVPVPSAVDLALVSAIHAVRDRFRPSTRTLLADVTNARERLGDEALDHRARALGVGRILRIASEEANGRGGWLVQSLRRADRSAPKILSVAPAVLVDGVPRAAISVATAALVLTGEHLVRRAKG